MARRLRPMVIGVAHPAGFVFQTPTISSALSFLVERGHQVHLISAYRFEDQDAGWQTHALGERHRWLASRYLRPLAALVLPFWTLSRVRRLSCDAVLAVDTRGALAASLSINLTRVPHVYLSLHIQFLRQMLSRRQYLRAVGRLAERVLLRRMRALVTQDRYRKQVLVEENGISEARVPVLLLPNSLRGAAQRHRSTYYRERMGVPAGPLVLVAGKIAPWAHLDFLIECARRQHDRPYYTLIVQSRDVLSRAQARRLQDLAHERVALSLEPVPLDDLGEAFGSATIGVALYTAAHHANQAYVGGASGRMMTYLQAGLPVIMMAGPGVTEVVREWRCGEVIAALDCAEFNARVREVIDAHDEYADNAVACYNERYDFDASFEAVHTFLLELCV